jgi:hypothetical protein
MAKPIHKPQKSNFYYNRGMDKLDWIIAVIFVLAMGAAFYFALPPYGAPLGAGMAAFLIYQAKKRRDNLRKRS